MKTILSKFVAFAAIPLLIASAPFAQASDLQSRIHAATHILKEKQHSDEPIPAELLSHAKGIAIFKITKAGLGIGGQGGEGIVVVRLPNGSWSAPTAIDLGGASIGAQIGFTEVRYIVVLNTTDAVEHFTGEDKVTFDGTATGNAGNDSATERVSTADLEGRSIVVYKDANGVFGGATLGGTTIERNREANHDAYGDVHTSDILSGAVPPPAFAARLYALLNGQG